MVGLARMDNIHACVETVISDGISGDLIETGVWRGGSTILMKAVLQRNGVTDRTVWVADSFEGLPPPTTDTDRAEEGFDLSGAEYLAVPLEEVARTLSGLAFWMTAYASLRVGFPKPLQRRR